MQYEVEIDGRVRRVAVSRAGGAFRVEVDGRARQVDAVRVDASRWSLVIDGQSHEVTITPDAATGQLDVRVGATPIGVSLVGGRRGGASSESGRPVAASGPERVVAPMPGKIVRVLVKPGEAVRARQPLVVVEAMKMENELRARGDGTVSEVHAREGSLVEAGTVLVVIQ